LCRRGLGAGDAAAGLAALGVLLGCVGAGAGLAAVLAPWGARAERLTRWIRGCLLLAGAAQALLMATAQLPVLAVAAFALGLGGQGTKIGVDTVVQRSVADEFRGRVFTAYD